MDLVAGNLLKKHKWYVYEADENQRHDDEAIKRINVMGFFRFFSQFFPERVFHLYNLRFMYQLAGRIML